MHGPYEVWRWTYFGAITKTSEHRWRWTAKLKVACAADPSRYFVVAPGEDALVVGGLKRC